MPHHLPEDQKIDIALDKTTFTPLDFKPIDNLPLSMCGGVAFHSIGVQAQPFTSIYVNSLDVYKLADVIHNAEPIRFGYGNDGTFGKHYLRGNGDNTCGNCGKWVGFSTDPANSFCNPDDVEVIRTKIHAQDQNLHLCDY